MKYTAHGKVILLGEHAVVYGHPALAGAIADGVVVETEPGSGFLRVPAFAAAFAPDNHDPQGLGRAYRALRMHLQLPPTSPVDLVASFRVPTGAGLGSSAALAVAVARALLAAHDLDLDESAIADAAMASETVVHGRPSGLDHTVAQLGGFGVFSRAGGLIPLGNTRPVALVVGDTGRARDTKSKVARIAALMEERGDEVRTRFAHVAQLVTRATGAIECGDFETLGRAMQENQEELRALDVSSPEIDQLCELAMGAGALGAKLTGGGGGGCVIALAPGLEMAVRDSWEREGFRAFVTSVGGVA